MKSQPRIQMNNQPIIKITNATTGQLDRATISNKKIENQQNNKKKTFYITNRQRSERMATKIPTGR